MRERDVRDHLISALVLMGQMRTFARLAEATGVEPNSRWVESVADALLSGRYATSALTPTPRGPTDGE